MELSQVTTALLQTVTELLAIPLKEKLEVPYTKLVITFLWFMRMDSGILSTQAGIE